MDNEKRTRIIAVANMKGGVGKTTTTLAVASIMCERGKKVLVVDLDAQANATSSLGVSESEDLPSIYESFVNRSRPEVIKIKEDGKGRMDVVPASLKMSWLDLKMAGELSRESILSEVLEEIRNEYDIILLDCPPSLGFITQNAFVAATDVLIPMRPEPYSVSGLKMIISFANMIKVKLNPQLNLLGLLLTHYERNSISQTISEFIREKFGDWIFDRVIRKNVAVTKAQAVKRNLNDFDPKCAAAEDYKALVNEIIERLK